MKKTNYKLPALPGLPKSPVTTPKASPVRSAGLSKISGFNKSVPKALSFGRAPRAATKSASSSKSGVSFSSVLSSATSGNGIAGSIAQSAGFGGGIGLLVSGLTSLFGGGKTTPPPLPAYQLPNSQSQTITIGSNVAVQGVYGGPPGTQPFANQASHIVQSVKQALLTSSSLNDVIAEL